MPPPLRRILSAPPSRTPAPDRENDNAGLQRSRSASALVSTAGLPDLPVRDARPNPAGAQPPTRLSPQERLEFDAYRLLRTADGRPFGEAELQRLSHAASSTAQVRTTLRHGPGNTRDQGAHLSGAAPARSTAALHFAQRLQSQGVRPLVAEYVGAIRAGGGNCGEFASVAVAAHIRHLPEGSQLERRSGTSLDHAWVREVPASPSQGEPIVIDAWSKGPPVSEADAWTQGQSSRCLDRLKPEDLDGPEGIGAKQLNAMELIENEAHYCAQVLSHLDQATGPMRAERVFERPQTLHPEAAQRMQDKLGARVESGDAGAVLEAKFDQGLKTLKRATDVLRQFPDTAASAPEQAPGLVAEARRLAREAGDF